MARVINFIFDDTAPGYTDAAGVRYSARFLFDTSAQNPYRPYATSLYKTIAVMPSNPGGVSRWPGSWFSWLRLSASRKLWYQSNAPVNVHPIDYFFSLAELNRVEISRGYLSRYPWWQSPNKQNVTQCNELLSLNSGVFSGFCLAPALELFPIVKLISVVCSFSVLVPDGCSISLYALISPIISPLPMISDMFPLIQGSSFPGAIIGKDYDGFYLWIMAELSRPALDTPGVVGIKNFRVKFVGKVR